MAHTLQGDLQKKFDHLMVRIQNNKRQALDEVRKNAARIGKISFIVETAVKHQIVLKVDAQKYEKLRKRVTEKDLPPAAVGAGIQPNLALSMMDCEFARGYNMIRNVMTQHYKEIVFPEKKTAQCKATNRWDRERQRTSKEIRTLSPF